MARIISVEPKRYPHAEAQEIAAKFSASDSEWTYRVVVDSVCDGMSFVDIYDEDDEYVGRWGEPSVGV